MTVVERVTFDTNILFYALDSDGGEKHTLAVSLLRLARSAESVLLLQTLAELYNAVRKRPDIPLDRTQEFIERNMEVFRVIALDRADLLRAISLQRLHKLHFWDSLLIVTALRAGCTYLISEDGHHGQTFGGLTIHNPFLASEDELTRIFRSNACANQPPVAT